MLLTKRSRQFGARGTPNFFINGRNLVGAQPFPAFKTIIDEELKKAEKLVAAGTPKAQVYAKLTAKGKTKAAAPKRPERKADTTVYKLPVSANTSARDQAMRSSQSSSSVSSNAHSVPASIQRFRRS